jgi:SAM-dependent methyltransferase
MAANNELQEYYSENLKKHGYNAQGVGWKNELAQKNRFDQLLKIITTDNFSINDLGCGSADLYSYLKASEYNSFFYNGYDTLIEMYEFAKEKYTNEKNIAFYHIDNAKELQPADYTIASGIFNLKYSESNENWLKYIMGTIDAMNNASVRGFAFNMLTSYSDKEFMKDHLYYSDPLYFFDYCKISFSKNVALLHDYNEYDFTILVRK